MIHVDSRLEVGSAASSVPRDHKPQALEHNDGLFEDGYGGVKFIDPIPDGLLCTVCGSVLKDPYQLFCCGSRLCKVCSYYGYYSLTIVSIIELP